jgi:predicted dehydrogenase
MNHVRIGIIGVGGMGGSHASYMHQMENASLAAVCDINPQTAERVGKKYNVPFYVKHTDLLASGKVDMVIIATPHYFHPPMSREAFAAGLHVLSEKPIAVGVKEARLTNKVYEEQYADKVKFGVMFQMRTNPVLKKVRELITGGELGQLFRMTWICTDWFRTWTYYASGGWRATWEGEGGGVLLNQCPHNMDQMQWLLGGKLPTRVTAVATVGKRHPIEVEDEVTAVMEYADGMVGHFITTTGEAPGTNRLEFAGDRGKLVVEGGSIRFVRTRKSVVDVLEKSPEAFAKVETWDCEVPPAGGQDGHRFITQNFVNAILKDEPMIAPGLDGVKGLELGNAIMLSGLTRTPVDLPVDGEIYDQFILDMARKYGGRKTLGTRSAVVDMAASFK